MIACTRTRAVPDLPAQANMAARGAAGLRRELISIVPPASPHWPVHRRSVPARRSPLAHRSVPSLSSLPPSSPSPSPLMPMALLIKTHHRHWAMCVCTCACVLVCVVCVRVCVRACMRVCTRCVCVSPPPVPIAFSVAFSIGLSRSCGATRRSARLVRFFVLTHCDANAAFCFCLCLYGLS